MKLLITGANGQLGSDLVAYCRKAGISCIGAGRRDFDITDRDAVLKFVAGHRPDAVIHCASYNAVDKAEDEEALCRLVNVRGSRNVAEACLACRAKMMYISTDYVFDGAKRGVYEISDRTGPLSAYGRSKLDGEEATRKILGRSFIVRTSWLFGKSGGNFVKTMLSLAKGRDEINVVCDQVGSPTYTADLAPLLVAIARSEQYGTFHATNEGFCSWAEFAREIMRLSGSDCKIRFVKSSEYPSRAVRPKNSRLSKDRLSADGFYRLPPWRDALERFLGEIGVSAAE